MFTKRTNPSPKKTPHLAVVESDPAVAELNAQVASLKVKLAHAHTTNNNMRAALESTPHSPRQYEERTRKMVRLAVDR